LDGASLVPEEMLIPLNFAVSRTKVPKLPWVILLLDLILRKISLWKYSKEVNGQI
jgi:hypothetical protein